MKNRAETKRTLIDATKELLCESESFTVKEISERAFTNVAAINYHFGDKNSLIRVALYELLGEFKHMLLETFDRPFADDKEALETVLQFLLEIYGRYQGAIKYILLAQDPVAESKMVEQFFFDSEFTSAFLRRLSETTGEQDPHMLFYKYSISISAFLFSLLIEGKGSSADDMISLTALQKEENKKAFISTLMLLYK